MKLIQTLFIILSVSIISGEIIEETGSLKEFLSGTQEGIAYDNFISHISKGSQIQDTMITVLPGTITRPTDLGITL